MMTGTEHSDIRRTLLFLIKNQQILLAMKKRGFGAGKWNGVGGKIEAGESVEQALVRECQEEIGVTPNTWDCVAKLDFQEFHEGQPAHIYCHVYFSEDWDGDPVESEEMAPKWFDIDQVPFDEMWEDDQYWLQRVLDGEKLIGKFIFNEQNQLISHELVPLD